MTIELREVAWSDPDGARLRGDQEAEVVVRYGVPDAEPGPAPTAESMTVFVVAYDGEDAVACGGLRALDDRHGEVKRMFVAPVARGRGISKLVLRDLERRARALGWDRLVLETGELQPEAMSLYLREGYAEIPPFGYYVGNAQSRCYEKVFAE